MASISITIPDAVANRVTNGLAGQYNYQATIPAPNPLDPPVPNPETKAQFAKRMVAKFIKDSVKAFEATQAAGTARDTAAADVETAIALT